MYLKQVLGADVMVTRYVQVYCIVFQVPDIGAEVTGGCYGFATKYMHWQEDLILGGVRKNQTGHIVRAEAMQSLFVLKGDYQMYEHFKDDQKTMNIDWTLEKAKMVLEAWHRRFTDVSNADIFLWSIVQNNVAFLVSFNYIKHL